MSTEESPFSQTFLYRAALTRVATLEVEGERGRHAAAAASSKAAWSGKKSDATKAYRATLEDEQLPTDDDFAQAIQDAREGKTDAALLVLRPLADAFCKTRRGLAEQRQIDKDAKAAAAKYSESIARLTKAIDEMRTVDIDPGDQQTLFPESAVDTSPMGWLSDEAQRVIFTSLQHAGEADKLSPKGKVVLSLFAAAAFDGMIDFGVDLTAAIDEDEAQDDGEDQGEEAQDEAASDDEADAYPVAEADPQQGTILEMAPRSAGRGRKRK